MVKLFTKPSVAPLHQVASELRTQFKDKGASVFSSQLAQAAASLESFSDPSVANAMANQLDDLADTVKGCFESANITLSDNELQAATTIMAAWGDPVAYHTKATAAPEVTVEGMTTFEPFLTNNHTLSVSAEAYNARELEKQIEYSVIFAAIGARQSPFTEAFYRTIVLSPDQLALVAEVQQPVVYPPVRRNASGRPVDGFGANIGRRLTDASIDPSILSFNGTDVVPVKRADSTNANQFVDGALVPTSSILLNGIAVPTAPLKFNVPEFDLLGLSQNQALLDSGVLTNTDELDANVSLKNIYVLVSNGTTNEVLKFDVSRIPGHDFQYAIEGQTQRLNLNFNTKSVFIRPTTTLIDGSNSTLLASLRTGGYTVALDVAVNGYTSVETAVTRVNASPSFVAGARNADGTVVPYDSGAVASALSGLTFTPIGYDLSARRTDSNFRTQGLQVNVNPMRERYQIRLKSPLGVTVPPVNTGRTVNIEALLDANRKRNDIDALTTMFGYFDLLKSIVDSNPDRNRDIPDIEGIGRHLFKPFFVEVECDVFEEINALTSSDRASDVTAVLVNKIRDVAYQMYRDSNYQTGLDSLTGGVGEKAHLQIGCDQILLRHLLVPGDTRTAGIGFDFDIKDSPDMRMYDKIVLTFTRPNYNGKELDAASFGNHAWVPELTGQVQVSRDGQTSLETMAQTRNRHINNLPVAAVINVKNLSKALSSNIILATSGS